MSDDYQYDALLNEVAERAGLLAGYVSGHIHDARVANRIEKQADYLNAINYARWTQEGALTYDAFLSETALSAAIETEPTRRRDLLITAAALALGEVVELDLAEEDEQ